MCVCVGCCYFFYPLFQAANVAQTPPSPAESRMSSTSRICLATLRASNPLPQRDHSIPSHVLRGLEVVWLVGKKAHQNLVMFKLGLYQNRDNKIVFDCSRAKVWLN
jgi:hypothetical protein